MKSSPTKLWLSHLSKSFAQFVRLVKTYQLKQHVRSVVVHTNIKCGLRHVSTADAPLARAVTEIWTQIFNYVEPIRIVVAAPSATQDVLLDTQLLSSDTWAFTMKRDYCIELTNELHGLQQSTRKHRFNSPARIRGHFHNRKSLHMVLRQHARVSPQAAA